MGKRHLAIGDIHGSFDALRTLAEFVSFRETDVIITLGDYIDRGPNSCAVIDWLIHHRRQLVPIRGNHEVMMLEARGGGVSLDYFLQNGGDATLASYSPLDDAGRLSDVPDAHWEFLESTLPHYEIDTHFFVHASAWPELALDEQPDFIRYWESFDDVAPHQSGKTMICGHTSQRSGVPKNLGHAVCIDTWAHGGGWLTCLDVHSGHYWQASQRRQTRRGWLDEIPA